MSVRQNKAGNWEVRVSYKGKRARHGSFPTKKIAEVQERLVKAKLMADHYENQAMSYQLPPQKASWHNPLKWLKKRREERKEFKNVAQKIEEM